MHIHNHDINANKQEIYSLKNRCKVESRHSRESLSIVFRDTTRTHPAAPYFSYKNIESAMYRARREVEPPIPVSAGEFIKEILTTFFILNYRDLNNSY